MEKQLEGWSEIAALIREDKERSLDDFHLRPFVPGELPAARPSVFRLVPALAIAASLLLAAGLVSLWLLRGGWRSAPAVPAGSEILADSFLYKGRSLFTAEASAAGPAQPVARCFTAWAAGLKGGADEAVEAVDPAAPVERGDPEAVRRKIGRMIHAGAIERLLVHMEQINKEA
jgi:hypothetical protein